MQTFFIVLFLALILICMLLHVPIVISGAHIGLELWYESVLPSILPFMIITSLLLQKVHGKGICFLGLFCGLPVGANLVNQQFCSSQFDSRTANNLLCICNITSPMFISGYILNQTLGQQISPLRFFLVLYLPLFLYGSLAFFQKKCKDRMQSHRKNRTNRTESDLQISVHPLPEVPASNRTASPSGFESVIRHSLQVILMVGIYIMLFCIVIQFLSSCLPKDSVIIKVFLSSLEITNGIHLLAGLPVSLQQKTALIAGLTSFGGICSILQTKSVLTDNRLSILHYSLVKLCMGFLSYILAWLLL